MNFQKFFLLKEQSTNPLIIIDVQPASHKYCGHIMEDLAGFINNHEGPIVAFFNGPELGMDEDYQVSEYFLEHGVEEEKVEDISFREKDYGWFRGWMDQGASEDVILKVIRHMISVNENDSRSIDVEDWKNILGEDFEDVEHLFENEEPIYMPNINFRQLSNYHGCFICGGGRDQCLREFIYLLDAQDIDYVLLPELVY